MKAVARCKTKAANQALVGSTRETRVGAGFDGESGRESRSWSLSLGKCKVLLPALTHRNCELRVRGRFTMEKCWRRRET
jgi:hypothetical protein